MSCEKSRESYLDHISQPGSAAALALGGEKAARAFFAALYQTAYNDTDSQQSKAQRTSASAACLRLFEEIEGMGLPRPTHSTRGLRLPRVAAQFGYKAVWEANQALRTGKPLPDMAAGVLTSLSSKRKLSGLHEDAKGYYRCTCGQFASRTREHNCPFTTSDVALERALRRRLGTPAGAYVYTTAGGVQRNGLAELLEEARNSPDRTVGMVHCLTGEELDVTLDGAILALGQGFVPNSWRGTTTLRHVELNDGRVVVALNSQGLNEIDPTAVLSPASPASGRHATHSATAAAIASAPAYGGTIRPGVPIHSLGASPSSVGLNRQQFTATAPSRTSATPIPAVAPNFANPIPAQTSSAGQNVWAPIPISGGTPYDWGHFTGSEYRKVSSRGTQVISCGRAYTVGARSSDPNDQSSGRRNGSYSVPRGGVAVGRTLVSAIDILVSSDYKAGDAGSEVYTPGFQELVSAYDANADVASDAQGTSNMSAEQVAAILAYEYDAAQRNPGVPRADAMHAFVQDLDAVRAGNGSPLAAADSAYLVMQELLKGGDISFGGDIPVQPCPRCGQFMGSIHNCPLGVPVPAPVEPAPPAQPIQGAQVPGSGQPVTVQIDMTAALTAFGEQVGSALRDMRSENDNQARQMMATQDRLAAALEHLAFTQEAQRDAPTGRRSAMQDEPSTNGTSAEPEPQEGFPAPIRAAVVPPPRPSLSQLPLTAQEHILSHVRPQELPDPYLRGIPRELGGQRTVPIAQRYMALDPNYDIDEGTERALRIVSASLQMAWNRDGKQPLKGAQMRAFGLAGTAGTGKNTLGRQVAASLGIPYYETTINNDTSIQEEVGTTTLRHGDTVAKLGPLGQAAASGAVICINELVKANKGTLGALQTMLEDGLIEVQGTEAGTDSKFLPVHPSTVFISTWNPGYDGADDRPDAALLSRMLTIKLDAPALEDETRRMVGALGELFGGSDGEANIDEAATAMKEARRSAVLAKDYSIRSATPSTENTRIAVQFVRDLRNLAATRQIGATSKHLLEPTPRETLRFAALCEATGDPLLAFEQFKIYCDAGEDYANQVRLMQQMFNRYYGEDGQALARRASGQGPQQN